MIFWAAGQTRHKLMLTLQLTVLFKMSPTLVKESPPPFRLRIMSIIGKMFCMHLCRRKRAYV